MPAESPPATKRETWRDWMPEGAPEPELLSRAELLDQLKAWRVDATERDLRFWEYEGILPRSIRRSHNGAVRAVYPKWYAYLPRRVRTWQRLGFSLEQIRRRIRAYAKYELGISPAPEDALDQEIRQHRMGPAIEGPEDIRLPQAMISELERLARWHERITGSPTDHVEVWVVDSEGNPTCYPWPIASEPRFVPGGKTWMVLAEPTDDPPTDTKN